MKASYDYIIVGAGTAGCVLAHRLSEKREDRVLLCEAGPPDDSWLIRMPAGLRSIFRPNSRYSLWLETSPQRGLNGRRVIQPRGQTLGGSSSINGMTFLRGNPLDYDGWAQGGCRGWAFADCLPYFKRVETYSGNASPYRGEKGNVAVSKHSVLGPLDEAFLQAGMETGYELTDDPNGYKQEGFGRFDMNVENGIRCSASYAYIHKQEPRPNLDVATNCHALQLLLDRDRVAGVELLVGNERHRVSAEAEVIVAAGVFGSPKLF